MNTLLLAVILALGLHCSSAQSFVPGLETDNADIQNAICNKHNELRRIVDPPASDMRKMVWSKEAAANAKKVAEKCIFNHSSAEERMIGTIECGENLYKTTKPVPWETLIQGWFNEYQNFTYGIGATKPGAKVGHYTQVVWNESSKIGCASKQCSNFVLAVCQYAPAGNYADRITTPYTKGIPCSKCPDNCDKGLCTNS
ncbi:cysteine-rich secretory protein 3-like [Lissotriton helveticus]